MTVSQDLFHTALLDPAQPVPEGLSNGHGAPAGKRFAVYRNNVAHSLTEALTLSFPAVQKLIGAENFRKLSAIFLRRHPPATPVLSQYGAEMPAFLERFEPLQHLAYLPDVARLEQAIRVSYHAADSSPADPAILNTLTPDALSETRFSLAPALQVLRSRWPIYQIWAFNMENGPKPTGGAENVLILRREFDPEPMPISNGTAVFVDQMRANAPLGTANDAAISAQPDFDLSQTLGLLLSGGAITDIRLENPQ